MGMFNDDVLNNADELEHRNTIQYKSSASMAKAKGSLVDRSLSESINSKLSIPQGKVNM
jgi:hypothetical protein